MSPCLFPVCLAFTHSLVLFSLPNKITPCIVMHFLFGVLDNIQST
nr:MAG TPA: hypothetical protein [Caudoviricetes sp.]